MASLNFVRWANWRVFILREAGVEATSRQASRFSTSIRASTTRSASKGDQQQPEKGMDHRVLTFVLLATLFSFGCARRAAQVPVPQLKARVCPKDSIEWNMPSLRYCADPPRCTQAEEIPSEYLCVATDPQTHQVQMCDGGGPCVFSKMMSCNPYAEQDCDADDAGEKEKKGHD